MNWAHEVKTFFIYKIVNFECSGLIFWANVVNFKKKKSFLIFTNQSTGNTDEERFQQIEWSKLVMVNLISNFRGAEAGPQWNFWESSRISSQIFGLALELHSRDCIVLLSIYHLSSLTDSHFILSECCYNNYNS